MMFLVTASIAIDVWMFETFLLLLPPEPMVVTAVCVYHSRYNFVP
jgi:hypothetical protein